MSATRTFTALTGGGAGSAYQAGDKFGYATAEKLRQSLDIAMYIGLQGFLGGDERPILSSSFVAVNGAMSFSLNADTLGGLTLEAVVYYYTTDASTSVQARVRNLTDSSTASTGTSSVSTTVVEEVLTLTLASGVKKYQLQVTGGDALNGVFCWGYLRLRKIAA